MAPVAVSRPRLAISLGDPCGIGPELLVKSLPDLPAEVVVVGSRAGLDLLAASPGAPVAWRWEGAVGGPEGFAGDVHRLMVSAARGGEATALWLDPTPSITAEDLHLGEGSAASGEATVEAIRWAARLTMDRWCEALVTLPMAKSAAHLAGHDIPGHTEFLQALAGAPQTRMAFLSPTLNVVLHTVHQSLRSVVENLDKEAVAETLVFSTRAFQDLTGRADLRVALCALNPHAGEAGAFGDEESLLTWALDAARRACPAPMVFAGPLPSDSVFQRAHRGEFDLVIALYHDQGLIPVKLVEPERAVNVTLGLPFVRTSPDHGTAFDKAGRWIADARNFRAAVDLAIRLSASTTLGKNRLV